MNLILAYVDYKFDIVQARGNTGSFRIHIHIKRRVLSPNITTIIVHEGLYATRDDALRMCKRIAMKGKVNIAHWIWTPSPDASHGCFCNTPTARYKTKPMKVKA